MHKLSFSQAEVENNYQMTGKFHSAPAKFFTAL